MEDSFKEQFAEGVDIVVDYLWGKSLEQLLIAAAKAGAEAVPIRFVQIGAISGPNITLPSAVLRPSAIELTWKSASTAFRLNASSMPSPGSCKLPCPAIFRLQPNRCLCRK